MVVKATVPDGVVFHMSRFSMKKTMNVILETRDPSKRLPISTAISSEFQNSDTWLQQSSHST